MSPPKTFEQLLDLSREWQRTTAGQALGARRVNSLLRSGTVMSLMRNRQRSPLIRDAQLVSVKVSDIGGKAWASLTWGAFGSATERDREVVQPFDVFR